MAEDKKFCGNAKPWGKFGGFKIGLKASDLPEPNANGYINLIMNPTRNDPEKYYVAVDDWTPDKAKNREQFQAGAAETKDVLPF